MDSLNGLFLPNWPMTDTKKYISYTELGTQPCIIVDGMRPNGLLLSHWKGANHHPEIADDTSGAIVLNAIKANFPGLEITNVSATHFDIDGFVGVWSLFHPQLALAHEVLLKEMALIGDFREFDPDRPMAKEALALVCWINKVELTDFYRPFGSEEEKETIACTEKFNYFIPAFTHVLLQPNKYKEIWEGEYEEVLKGCAQMQTDKTKTENFLDIGLQVVYTPEPLHYYSLFSQSAGFDMVLSCYHGNRYELEYKYTTWVDVSRDSLPRINFNNLADHLNQVEKSGYQWCFDKISDSGPILRLENTQLSKADRYANPTGRVVFSSSIPVDELVQFVVMFYQSAYRHIKPKKNWTWQEVYALNKN